MSRPVAWIVLRRRQLKCFTSNLFLAKDRSGFVTPTDYVTLLEIWIVVLNSPSIIVMNPNQRNAPLMGLSTEALLHT